MEPKRRPKDKAQRDADPAMDDDEGEEEVASAGGRDDGENRRPPSAAGAGGSGGPSQPCCQAELCTADLTVAKRYHRRHKVCDVHFKAPVVIVAGLRQRFCQQCSRFHELSEFDEAKRSCRNRLAGHNQRRRKSSSETPAPPTSTSR